MSFDTLLGGNLALLLFLVVPGFISIKVYDLLVPGDRRDFSRALLEMAAYGAINYGLLLGAFIRVIDASFASEHPYMQWGYLVLMLLVAPVLWPLLWLGLKKVSFIKRRTVPAIAKPWDDFFFKSQKTGEKYWVIVHLKDGRKVAGKYGSGSYASTGRVPEQLYLEELYEVLEDGRLEKVSGTKGALFVQGSIEMLELFAIKEEKDDDKE